MREQNILLDLMSEADRATIDPHLERVELTVRQSLFEVREPIEYVHFLLSGLSSEIASGEDGSRIEVGCVGREGLSGHSVVLGVETSPHHAFMQVRGAALRIRAGDLRRCMETSPGLRDHLLRYVHVFMVQVASSALADARFTIEQRLARWLLMSQDRVGTSLPLTHEFLSLMLAVRRSGVTDAIHILEGERLIKAERAAITVLDRAGLQAKAGGSYGVAEHEYERIFKTAPWLPAAPDPF